MGRWSSPRVPSDVTGNMEELTLPPSGCTREAAAWGADQLHLTGGAARFHAVAGGAEGEVAVGQWRGLGGVHFEQRGGRFLA